MRTVTSGVARLEVTPLAYGTWQLADGPADEDVAGIYAIPGPGA